MTWRRLGVLVRGLPVTSRAYQAVHGEQWGRTDNLLAGLFDQLALANWQRGADKKAKRPRPLPRPGVKVDGEGKRWGTESMSIDEWRRRYAARFPERGEHGRRASQRLRQHHPVSEGDQVQSR